MPLNIIVAHFKIKLDINLNMGKVSRSRFLAVKSQFMNLVNIFKKPVATRPWVDTEEVLLRRNFFLYIRKTLNDGSVQIWAHSTRNEESHLLGNIRGEVWDRVKGFYTLPWSIQKFGDKVGSCVARGEKDIRGVIHRMGL